MLWLLITSSSVAIRYAYRWLLERQIISRDIMSFDGEHEEGDQVGAFLPFLRVWRDNLEPSTSEWKVNGCGGRSLLENWFGLRR